MSHEFRRLRTESDFPLIDNVEVYKYDNNFDYSRYDYTQMQLQLCSVPWDMGEAHIGNRTISGIGNVVYFGSKNARDDWFDAIPDNKCFRFETKFKELHRDYVIDVPIPYDVCAKFNYLKVHYSLFANDDSPVIYEDDDGLRDWFWFVREVEFVAPNTTRLHLLDDAFQTWIYDVDVTGMILERGHAPMIQTKASSFLQNPIENCANLLTEDVNFGTISQVKHMDALVFNESNMVACIATSAYPRGTWGTKAAGTWNTPAGSHYTENGQPSAYVFAVAVADLNTLLENIDAQVPQFKQTIKGVFFASTDLVTLGTQFTFAGVECNVVTSNRKTLPFVTLSKTHFGYESRYAEIAKLYTSPYAHIEITDENGDVDIVKVEDTSGTLDVSAMLSIAYPFVTLDAHLLGAGGNASATVTYRNVTQHSFAVSGQWYDTLRTWNIPTFAIVLDASTEYDYSTHFDRAQRAIDYATAYNNALGNAVTARDNTYDNANMVKANTDDNADTVKTNTDASADAAKTNADASATTAKNNVATIALANKNNAYAAVDTAKTNADTNATATKNNTYASAGTAKANADRSAQANKLNADDNAQTLLDNTEVQITANTAINETSNAAATTDTTFGNALSQALQAWEAGYARQTANNEVDAAYASAAIGAAGGAIGSAVSGAAGGAAAGPVGAAAGAIGGLITGAISGATTMAQTAVAANLTTTQAEATVSLSQNKVSATATNNYDRTDNQIDANTDNCDTTNDAADTMSTNSANTLIGNATRTKTAENQNAAASETTSKANADRTETAEKTNALATQTTGRANADRTQTAENAAATESETTAKANATRTQTVTKANATRTQTVTKANATRTQTVTKANALRTYNNSITIADRDRQRAIDDISNDVKQAALRSPFEFGEYANGESAATKPMALFANIVTQSKAAIGAAGDEFLRYGYRLDRYWEFDGNWNIGKYFTYWKLRDFWVSNLNVPDMYMDKLRFFLFGGVTIWRAPEYIGVKNIYENFE